MLGVCWYPKQWSGSWWADDAPAVLRAGHATDVARWPDAGLLRTIMRGVLANAGLGLLDLPPGLRLRRRGNLTFAINSAPGPEPGPEREPWPLREGATPVLGDAIVEPQDVAAWQS